jgi:hypothetical protein
MDLTNIFREKVFKIDDSNSMVLRQLEYSDYEKDYINLYKAFTEDLDTSKDNFNKFYQNYIKSNKAIYVLEEENKLIGTISLIIEQKPFHNFQYVVHIEDFVINGKQRGLGTKVLTAINQHINHVNEENTKENNQLIIYKIILDCDECLQNFYSKNDFAKKGIYMARYILIKN